LGQFGDGLELAGFAEGLLVLGGEMRSFHASNIAV
jgi:hypothetical protein